MAQIDVKVPDIGDFKDVPVIIVFVKPGDTVKAEDPLIEIESDKATMEVPSPASGTVVEVKLKEGDRVSEGAVVLVLEGEATAGEAARASVSGGRRDGRRPGRRATARRPGRSRRSPSRCPTSATSRTCR